ncbi:N-6 DNA methylase, partial [Streptococcus suis]
DFKLTDRDYDRENFLIHDYFFAKSIDKIRSGGIIAFVTSSGTMDKQDSRVRQYLANRCDLLGAIRLPNDTFKGLAGTEVTSDILVLQKRDV